MILPLLHLWRRFTEKLYLVSVSLRFFSPGTTSWHAYYSNALFYVLLICFPWRRCSMVKSSGEIEVFKKLGNVCLFVCLFFYWKASQTYALWISKKVIWFRKTLIWLCKFYYWFHLCSLEECRSHGIKIFIQQNNFVLSQNPRTMYRYI